MDKKAHINQDHIPSFKVGDLVWVKVTGYPRWPAIVKGYKFTTLIQYRVDFLADNSQ